MRVLGIAVAVIVLGAAMMVFLSRAYVRPWRSRRSTERLLRENAELDRQIEAMQRERREH